MGDGAHLLLPLGVVVPGWVLAGGSPGPATLTISGKAMSRGRVVGRGILTSRFT